MKACSGLGEEISAGASQSFKVLQLSGKTSGLQRCLPQHSASGTGWAGLQGQDVEVSACPRVTRTIHLGPHTCILSEQVWVPCLEDNKTIFPAPSFEKKGHYEGSDCPCESGLKRLLSLELISRRFLLTHTTPL